MHAALPAPRILRPRPSSTACSRVGAGTCAPSGSARPRSRHTQPRSASWRGSSSAGHADHAVAIRREHVEAFITDILERWKPATAHNRYRGCQPSSAGSSRRARSATTRWRA